MSVTAVAGGGGVVGSGRVSDILIRRRNGCRGPAACQAAFLSATPGVGAGGCVRVVAIGPTGRLAVALRVGDAGVV
jgi:hypothetical protein